MNTIIDYEDGIFANQLGTFENPIDIKNNPIDFIINGFSIMSIFGYVKNQSAVMNGIMFHVLEKQIMIDSRVYVKSKFESKFDYKDAIYAFSIGNKDIFIQDSIHSINKNNKQMRVFTVIFTSMVIKEFETIRGKMLYDETKFAVGYFTVNRDKK